MFSSGRDGKSLLGMYHGIILEIGRRLISWEELKADTEGMSVA
jgi:hypothetical protein